MLIHLVPQAGREHAPLQFTLSAADLDGDTLPYIPASPSPAGSYLDPHAGVFQWTPSYEQAGDYILHFRAQDPGGLSDTTDVAVHIEDVNRPPTLHVTGHSAALGKLLSFTLKGADPDAGDTLTYGATNLPDGLQVDPQSGLVQWTPGPGQSGEYLVTFSVTDGKAVTKQTVLIRAALAAAPPSVAIELTPSFPAVPGQLVQVHVIAQSVADIVQFQLSADGKSVALDAGRASFIAGAPGRVQLDATAMDADGLIGQASQVLKVRDPNSTKAPVVSLDPLLNGSSLSVATAIVGTVQDSNLDTWMLERAPVGHGAFVPIASGSASITNAPLAIFDTAGLANGLYRLRLTATDFSGRTSSTESIVEANTTTKTDEYRRAETDLVVQLGSTIINVVRAYDSLGRDQSGSFGFGWRLANRDTFLQSDVAATGRELLGVYNPFRDGTRVFLTLPDGSRVGFTFAPQPHTQTGLTYYTPSYVPDSGVSVQLASASGVLSKVGSPYYDLATGRAYNPARGAFTGPSNTLTTPDGTAYYLDASGNVVERITPVGARLYFSDSGITDSSGAAIRFERDSGGRLTRIVGNDTILRFV